MSAALRTTGPVFSLPAFCHVVRKDPVPTSGQKQKTPALPARAND